MFIPSSEVVDKIYLFPICMLAPVKAVAIVHVMWVVAITVRVVSK